MPIPACSRGPRPRNRVRGPTRSRSGRPTLRNAVQRHRDHRGHGARRRRRERVPGARSDRKPDGERGSLLTFTATATDEENDEIIFSIDAGGLNGATIDANTGVFVTRPRTRGREPTTSPSVRRTLCTTPCSDTETIQVTVLDGAAAAARTSAPCSRRSATRPPRRVRI